MNKQKEALLKLCQKELALKFRKGDKEHQEDFFSLDLLSEAIKETQDLLIYLTGLREKLKK